MDAAVAGISISKAALQSQLSKCARFQTFIGGNEAAALARIKFDALPFPLDENGNVKEAYSKEELETARPFAMIFSDSRRGYSLNAVGSPTACVEAGTLQIHFEKDISDALRKDPESVNRQWDNDLGQIARQLMDLKATDGMLQIDGQITVQGPFFSMESEQPGQGNFCYALMTVTWGLGGGT
jgi:hypothetical protein